MREIKPPSLERDVGLEIYLSKNPGIKGHIKELPEDFLVEEITPDGKILETDKGEEEDSGEKQEYIHFTLQKHNWATMRAINKISNRLRVSRKRFGFAGTKDKRAVTTQRVSLWNKEIEELMEVKIKDLQIRNPHYAPERINLGELWGNRFTILIKGVNLGEEKIKKRVNSIMEELNFKIPGYFGVQRFGITRPITHLVGKEILKGDFKQAVMIYLAKGFPDESKEGREAREFLSETENFKEALLKFPKYLDYEKSMLNHLVKTPTDPVGALRRLPKKLRWMFVHAYQSYLFNKSLSSYLKNGLEIDTLPLPGYECKLDEITSQILEEEGLSQENFKVDPMPEMSSQGEERKVFFEVKNFKIISLSPGNLAIQFSLPKGTYATVLLRELMKNEYWKK